MAAPLRRDFAAALGMLEKRKGVALPASFVVDPENVAGFVSANDLCTVRSRAARRRVSLADYRPPP